MYYPIVICIFTAICLQFIDYLYHRQDLSILKFELPTSFKEFRKKFAGLTYKKFDNYFAMLPFIWSWLFIIAAVLIFHQTNSIILQFILILFVTGRMRSLQEIGHFAIHGALCPNMKWGMFLANIFYQFPMFMPEAVARRKTHVIDHHNMVNMPNDPDLKEFLDKNFVPKISNIKFWINLFYYLTPKGIFDRCKECLSYLLADKGNYKFYLRIVCVLVIIGIGISLKLYSELVFLYFIPVLITYPTAYWLAHVALHRWFASCPENIEYYERELEIGRPTDFKEILGFIIKHNLFPVGDSYHLAHSLFPIVRWTYLPQIDKILKQYCPNYINNRSCNLFFSEDNVPSIYSELKKRMVYD